MADKGVETFRALCAILSARYYEADAQFKAFDSTVPCVDARDMFGRAAEVVALSARRGEALVAAMVAREMLNALEDQLTGDVQREAHDVEA